MSAAKPHSIGVVAALSREARTLTRMRLTAQHPEALGAQFLVCVSGMGASRARTGARALLASGASALLSWGVAAALVPDLKTGTLMLPRTVLAADAVAMSVDAEWHANVAGSANCDLRPIVHTGTLLSPAQKRALGESLPAAAADMESAAVAQVASEAGVPFIAVRAIADELEQAVPAWLASAVDPYGGVVLTTFCIALARHPWDLPAVIGLGRAFAKAQDALKRFQAQHVRFAG